MQQVNVRALVAEVNILLVEMDLKFDAAKRAFGVRPDLKTAEERINDAGATVAELVLAINQMEAIGIHQPEDVYARIADRYKALHLMANELDQCKLVVHIRSHSGRPQNTLN
jgi:hypothetical protein